ncbi:hypothetical protein [Pseudonocardia sp. H11422]|uniref:hypothetical protein n=1 Tax=Pseudonocardia sp. H11422 TaxID=2835866 RepID=UPI001BDDB10B|nr:hypothetical protein [Pseudonocardia sp. H11422]
MTIAGGLELLAWMFSAVIAGWLVLDMVRVARDHDEHVLTNAAETTDGLDEPRSRDTGGEAR